MQSQQRKDEAFAQAERAFALGGARAAARQVKALARGLQRHPEKLLLDAEFRLRLIREETRIRGEAPWWASGLYLQNLRASAIAARYARRYKGE